MLLFPTKADRSKYLGFDDHLAILLGLPILAVVANTLFLGQLTVDDGRDYLICYGISISFCVAYWFVSRSVVIVFRRRFPDQRHTLHRIGWTLGTLAATTVLISVVGDWLVDQAAPPAYGSETEPPLLYKFLMAYTLVIMVMAIYEGIYFFVMYRRSALEQERLARENVQAQLSVLKQQMNPHFLFNSLNTLVNVIPEDGQKATLFTQRLAAVYRRVLEYRHKELIGLEEELTALQDYIFLMQTRFEDKLSVHWHLSERTGRRERARAQVPCADELPPVVIPPHLRFHRIVPLSVQLLVENAIKHNVISRDHPLRIDITLDDEAVTVTNARRDRERTLNSTGWGHENLRRRYAAVTGRPVVIDPTEDHYRVSLPILPPTLAVRAATA